MMLVGEITSAFVVHKTLSSRMHSVKINGTWMTKMLEAKPYSEAISIDKKYNGIMYLLKKIVRLSLKYDALFLVGVLSL